MEQAIRGIIDPQLIIWAIVIGVIIVVGTILTAILIVTKKKEPEPFLLLKDELVKTHQVEPAAKDNPDIPGKDRKKMPIDDDIKTRNLFDDQSIGLYSYHLELQDIKTGEKYTCGIAERIRIGRRPDCNIAINHNTVSNCHCEVMIAGGVLVLRDLQSVNGTFINGVKITGGSRLTSGVILRLGQKEYLVTVADFRERKED